MHVSDGILIENLYTTINSFGYVLLKGIYGKDDIRRIEQEFDRKFCEDLQKERVQSRDYRRFACKVPISRDYEPILCNPFIHELMTRILGEDYVLFNFNSHSSLPGSSQQQMHVDSMNPLDTNIFVSKEANVAFLHIPLSDMNELNGPTEVWPVTFYTPNNPRTEIRTMRWIRDSKKKSNPILERGDVIVRVENCVHAGGANRGKTRRHMITLIFARKYYYLNKNSGRIPGGAYDGPNMPRAPFRISAHIAAQSVSVGSRYVKQNFGKRLSIPDDFTQQIQFNQYVYLGHGISDKLLASIESGPREFIKDASWVFNLVEHLLPVIKAAFQGTEFSLHSVRLNEKTRELECDDPTFRRYRGEAAFPNVDNLFRMHLPLKDSEKWIMCYPGNKTLSMNILKNSENIGFEHMTCLAAKKGVGLITTGTLVYSRVANTPTLELTFARFNHMPSYDDRYRVTDSFALTLPRKLGMLLRYDNVLITQPQFKDFQSSRLFTAGYAIYTYIINQRMDHPLKGKLLQLLAGILMVPGLLYFKISQKYRPVLSMLKSV